MPDNQVQPTQNGYIANPLSSVITGMLQGHQLGLQMRQQNNADADEQLRQALGQQQQTAMDQAAQEKDFQAAGEFMNHTRRVNSAGQVLAPLTDQRAIDAINGAGTVPGQAPAQTPGPGQAPATAPAGSPAPAPAPDPNLPPPENNDPLSPGYVPPPQSPQDQMLDQAKKMGGVLVAADKSRLATFKDRNGNTYTGERYTPQEENERQLAADLALKTQDAGIVKAADVQKIKKEEMDNQMVPDPSNPGKQIRQGDLLEAMKVAEQARKNKVDESDVQTGQTNALKIASDRLAAEKAERDAAEAGRNSRAADRNRTILQKGSGNGGLTANAQGVQGRFDQREIDADTKTMEAAQTAEQKAHAMRSDIGAAVGTEDGETYQDPLSASGKEVTMNPIQRARLKAAYDQQTALAEQKAAIQKSIRQKHQWGEFAPGARTATQPAAGGAPDPGTTPPAATRPAAPQLPAPSPSPQPKLSGVRIKVQIKMPDGSMKTGSVDKSQFNAATMKQVGQ